MLLRYDLFLRLIRLMLHAPCRAKGMRQIIHAYFFMMLAPDLPLAAAAAMLLMGSKYASLDFTIGTV